MINLYAYSYPAAMQKYAAQGLMLIKLGDSHRDIEVRMGEQGGAAEWESKVTIGGWHNLKKIARDFDVHEVLRQRGLWVKEGAGTEWFRVPATTIKEAYDYIDAVVTELEGNKVRKPVKLRAVQERALDQAMAIIDTAHDPSIIANLCARFGKTIWALMLFNRIHEKYGNKVMLLPAYWLSVHRSFTDELDEYDDFLNIREVDADDPNARETAITYLNNGYRIVVPVSLHGAYEEWTAKHQWLKDIPNDEIFMFADEGDFGTHTDNQVAKLDFIFDQ